MALQHLRSGTADKRPTPGAMADGQLAINTNATSTGLFFKDSAGALVKVGPVHIGTTAPNATPASGGQSGNTVGEQWLDTTGGNYVLKIWDGSAWRSEAGEFVNASGDTMTGALVMDNQQQVRFRETTANGTNFIALQAPASVASDKTITLPDVTGTVVTTGDTGSVTSAMIADSTIVDGDISASAEIAVSKLADGTARQLLQTDAAGTGVEWTSNVDVPGTLDVTSTATFDSIISASAGAAATPSITFTGDTNTGIYSPGADQVAISSNGVGRLFIDASGNVGVGSTAVSEKLHVNAGNICLSYADGSTGLRNKLSWRTESPFFDETAYIAVTRPGVSGAPSDIVFANGGAASVTEKLRITSDGKLGLGTSSVSELFHMKGASPYMLLEGTETNAQTLYIRENAGGMYFGRYGVATRMLIDDQGRVGIGTTSPTATLEVKGGQIVLNTTSANSSAVIFRINDVTKGYIGPAGILGGSDNDMGYRVESGNNQAFYIGASERARIDSSGRLLVGTSSARGSWGITPFVQYEGAADSTYRAVSHTYNDNSVAGPLFYLSKSRGSTNGSNTIVQAGDELGQLIFAGADGTGLVSGAAIRGYVDGTPGAGDLPTRLVFSTTADGASSPTTAAIFYSNKIAEFYNDIRPSQDNVFQVGQSGRRWSVVYAGTGSINTSDEKLKQDIEALSDAELTVAQQIKSFIKKYRFKDAVEKKGADARIHVGVIAQEVEQAFVDAGLDVRRYGLFCEDELEDGTKRLAIRYDELLAFILAAL